MLTDRAFVASVRNEFPGGAHLTYRLHPPVLKAMGRRKKVGFGPRTHVVLRALAKGKRLRGTWFDPFGHTRMRRLERQLGTHYEALVTGFVHTLTADSYDAALTAASAIDIVRGYEDVKMRNIHRYVERLRELAIGTDDLVSR
jgi:indolepyruvate ferredoxin oxidoreductase